MRRLLIRPRAALVALLVLAVSAVHLAQQPSDPPDKKECTAITTTGAPGHCSPSTCFFLGPFCSDECVILQRQGGTCQGSATTACVMSNQTFSEKLCQVCRCSGLLGNCTDSGTPVPRGTVEEWRCTQAPQ